MAFRSSLTLIACVWIACGKDDKSEPDHKPQPPELAGDRCVTLGKLCGDKGKHVDKMVDECNQAAKKQAEKGCTDKANAAYDCYEQKLCGKADKVWTINDLDVLAERHNTCLTERNALRSCVGTVQP